MQNANDAYSSNVKAISEDKTIVDEEKRFQALLDAEELFRQQKYAINEKYTLMEQELRKMPVKLKWKYMASYCLKLLRFGEI